MTDHKNIIKNLTETEAQEYADIELAEELKTCRILSRMIF